MAKRILTLQPSGAVMALEVMPETTAWALKQGLKRNSLGTSSLATPHVSRLLWKTAICCPMMIRSWALEFLKIPS